MRHNPEIELYDLAKAFDKLEPFEDFDGHLHAVAQQAFAGKASKNITLLGRGNLIGGRFYLAGRVRGFAYTNTERLGDLARFMDVLFHMVRPLRRYKKEGTTCDADLNFTVAQMEADVKYFFERRKDVWELLQTIRKRVTAAMKDAPTDRKASNLSNMEKYNEIAKDTRRFMLEEIQLLQKHLDGLIKDRFQSVETKLAALAAKLSPAPAPQPSVITPAQTELPTQPFKTETGFQSTTC